MARSAPAWLARELVALRAQPRDDPLGIDQRLRAAERNEGNARRGARLATGGPIALDWHGRIAAASSLFQRPDIGHAHFRGRVRAVDGVAANDDGARIERHLEALGAAADRPFGDEAARNVDAVDRLVALVELYFPERVVRRISATPPVQVAMPRDACAGFAAGRRRGRAARRSPQRGPPQAPRRPSPGRRCQSPALGSRKRPVERSEVFLPAPATPFTAPAPVPAARSRSD